MMHDSRLSGVLHLLLHMAEGESPLTSATLARLMRTNSVVVRRLLSGLRERGLVRSQKGHGGGWTLSADLSSITLRDVYDALDRPPLFAIGNRHQAPDCLVEQSVNATLGDSLDQAEQLLLASFGAVTLADIRADVDRRLNNTKRPRRGERDRQHAHD